MTYDTTKTTKSTIKSANKEMDATIKEDKKKLLLRDYPAVKSNQNVYDNLSE